MEVSSACAAQAMALVVPDDAATIQAAVDAFADTVFVRPGTYAESLVVSLPVSLIGTAAEAQELPSVASLTISVAPSEGSLFDFQGLRIQNAVLIVSDHGSCAIAFSRCSLLGGLMDRSVWVDTESITLFRCTLSGSLELRARGWSRVDSCSGTGQIRGTYDGAFAVRGCSFQGDGTGWAAISSTNVSACLVEGNAIRGYINGIAAASTGETRIVGNVIEDCGRGIGAGYQRVTVTDNVVRRGGRGIEASGYPAVVRSNNLSAGSEIGIVVQSEAIEVVGNVIVGYGGDGVLALGSGGVTSNTSSLNGGSGFVADEDDWDGIDWVGNIGYRNARYGIRWRAVGVSTVRCNNWFANMAGEVQGRPLSGEDVSMDPQFCDVESSNFHLDSSSPLVDWPGCGQIGALGVGCGKTATLVQRFTAERVRDGIRVAWEVGEGATASEIWLERVEVAEGQGWTRPITERTFEGEVVVELDRSALSDRSYSYRLIALEEAEVTVIGAPIVVETHARLDSRLVDVGPNPGDGPVRIAFTVKHAALIEIDVFDVQGRRVASPGRGAWAPGTHELVWDGRLRNGKPASAGMYIVRYAFPGGQDQRAIVRVW